MIKDLLIRFLLGGAAVMMSYMVTVVSPWRILAGIFAAFPAVMITAVVMVGGLMCVATVWTVLQLSHNWMLSILLGVLSWLCSSLLVSVLRERVSHARFPHLRMMASRLKH